MISKRIRHITPAFLTLLILAHAQNLVPSECLAVSDKQAGRPIGRKASNMDMLQENLSLERDARLSSFYFCLNADDGNNLSGLQFEITQETQSGGSDLKL